MPVSPVKAFQQAVAPRLGALFAGVPIETEWAAMRDEDGVYSPRLDIAVGPFAVGNLIYVAEFNELVEQHGGFLGLLYEHTLANLREHAGPDPAVAFDHVVHRNANARCFLAFEIENQVSRKHLMGGAINAAALARVGVAVGWTAEKVRAFVKLRSYLLFLSSVGKNTFDPVNLLILSKEQLLNVLDSFTPKAA